MAAVTADRLRELLARSRDLDQRIHRLQATIVTLHEQLDRATTAAQPLARPPLSEATRHNAVRKTPTAQVMG